jgi:hypothetical protein
MDVEYVDEAEEKKGFFLWLKSKFGSSEEEGEIEIPHYKRRLLDGRIEKYLDQNFNSYIQEYGIVNGLDLESYEERYQDLTGRIADMKEYMLESDAVISSMEKDIQLIKKEAGKKKK